MGVVIRYREGVVDALIETLTRVPDFGPSAVFSVGNVDHLVGEFITVLVGEVLHNAQFPLGEIAVVKRCLGGRRFRGRNR